jgi:hypothetical protein
MRRAADLACLALAACGGVTWNTTVADTADVRMQMVQSVRIGVTTDDAFVLRWGPPLQKAREGGRVDFIYRRQNESARFVIVTFDYGVASGVRSTETEACRATFAPRVPGYGFDWPGTAVPVGYCTTLARPGVPLDTVGTTRDPNGRPLPK